VRYAGKYLRYNAKLPEEAGEDKYDAEAGSIISLLKYGSGFPYYRMDNFQKALGVPVPTSTQWDIAHSVFKVAVHPYEELVRQAAQGELFHTDDTGVKILSIMKENKKKKAVEEGTFDADWKKRKATYTSIPANHVKSKRSFHRIVFQWQEICRRKSR